MKKLRAVSIAVSIAGSVIATCLFAALPGLAQSRPSAALESSWIKGTYRKGDFKLVYGGRAANILVSPDDFKVARIAAADLAGDIERVTGSKPAVRTEASTSTEQVVLIGTLGKSPLLDSIIHARKLDVTRLRGQWESFLIAVVDAPLPHVRTGLLIIGSDRRGTAYGVYELSQAIGVSPFYWWADVVPEHRTRLVVAGGARREGPPSVKYRGIFLNDEDWGLQPWAAKTFEPETGDVGPKTYARICELLLRLKANTLWPAMHEVTRAFNLNPENSRVADDYAIVMGSSHAEPMLRNNVSEWKEKPEDYNYLKNPLGVRRYWETRVAENSRFENLYTLGMRGIHDSAIQGPKTSPERIKLLEQIFVDQRAMLARHVNPRLSEVPQIFVPYKEVLADYRNGLKVPEDVTIIWPDDNFGYIRYFPTAEERQRAGGFGVYYHISYLGRPLSYLWLETTPPALIWEEMSKAYENGARKFWVLNVGDLKPAEVGMEFFMQMAWDMAHWQQGTLPDFLKSWASREFGTEHANEVSSVMDEYYRLAFARKPEHLQWYLPGETPRPSDMTQIDYGDEVQQRLDAYDALRVRADRLYAEMPARLKDAFYELVAYPVRGAALANHRYFMMEKSALYAAQGRASASRWADASLRAGEELKAATDYYNDVLAGGKWRHIMALEMRPGQWQSMRSTPPSVPPELARLSVKDEAGLGVAIEGRVEPLREGERDARLPEFNLFTRDVRFVDVFNLGRAPAAWVAKANQDWIKLSRTSGSLSEDARMLVSVDWATVPKGVSISGSIEITGAGATRIVNVSVFNPQAPRPESVAAFVESGGVISIEAEHFTGNVARNGAGWGVIQGLGRTGDSVAVFPTNAPSVEPGDVAHTAPLLEYSLHLFKTGNFKVTCYLVPTHSVRASNGLRLAIGLDDQEPQLVTVDTDVERSAKEWSREVLDATTRGMATLQVKTAGPHVLKVYMVDPGVVLDKLVIDTGGERPSYLGPPETRVRRK